MWLLSEVLAVELNVFQVPSAGGGVFLAMALAAGTDGLAQKCTQNILQLELGGGSRRVGSYFLTFHAFPGTVSEERVLFP